MLDACREAGLSPVICSSYRTREKQEKLFQNKVEPLTAADMPAAGAGGKFSLVHKTTFLSMRWSHDKKAVHKNHIIPASIRHQKSYECADA